MGDDVKGFIFALATSLAAGGGFTQTIPKTADEWWKFGVGMVVVLASTFIAWQRQQPARKQVWSEEERAVKTGGIDETVR